jgi:hypothetical protein
VLLIVGVVVILGAATAALVYRSTGGSDDVDTTATTAPAGVFDSDEVVTEIPQSPSLRILLEDGTWYVENDGNVTMSDVEVRDGSDSVICELGTISPADRGSCAAPETEELRARGLGPQGQVVETGSN